MNELFFLWGPPHAGQIRWMSKDFEASSEYGIQTSLLPLQDLGDEFALASQLKKVEALLNMPDKNSGMGHHIFCELPWSLMDEDLEVEDWIENVFKKHAFKKENEHDWNLAFICICPFEAQKLPKPYRDGLENFSRGSNSAVIVVKQETDQADPPWLQSGEVDFGRHVEVLEDFIWPLKGELGLKGPELMSFASETRLFETLELPLAPEKTDIRNLLIEIAKGTFGKFWGAEATWRSAEGKFEALSLSQNKLFSWSSEHPNLLELTSLNGARLSASGFDINWDLLKKAITSIQRFC